MTQLRDSGCKHIFVPRSFSTATNLQKQANICIIIVALMHHSRWRVFAIVLRASRGKEGGVRQVIICITIGAYTHHSKVWCTCEGGVVARKHKKGEVAVFYIIFTTRSGGHRRWLIPKII